MLDTQHILFKTRKRRGIFFVAMLFVVVGLLFAQPIRTLAANTPGWKIVASPNASTTSVSNNTLDGVTAI